MEQKLQKRVKELFEYFLDWEYPSRSFVDVMEKIGTDKLTLNALAALNEAKIITMGQHSDNDSPYCKYFSLVNPDTFEEMQSECCYNYPDSHVYGNWFTTLSLKDQLHHSPEEQIIIDRLNELQRDDLISLEYAFGVRESLEAYKYICVNHGNQLLKCEECRDFTRRLKILVNAGDLDLQEIEKEIFANHVQPWKKERGQKIESTTSNR